MTVKRFDALQISGSKMARDVRLCVAASDYDAVVELLSACSHECSHLSHKRNEFHAAGEPCPVEARIRAALTPRGEHP